MMTTIIATIRAIPITTTIPPVLHSPLGAGGGPGGGGCADNTVNEPLASPRLTLYRPGVDR